MGITIYYAGKLRSMEQLPSLIKTVTTQCDLVHWEYTRIYSSFDIPIQGIAFEPKGSHAIWMTFLDDGRLVAPHDYIMAKEMGKRIKNDYQVDTKTHFAGAGVHMQIVDFIRDLSTTFFSKFRMFDDSEYWQTNNRNVCENEFRVMEKWVGQMIQKLDNLDGRPGDIGDAGEIMDERIIDLLRRMDPLDLVEQLHTPPPKAEMLRFFWN